MLDKKHFFDTYRNKYGNFNESKVKGMEAIIDAFEQDETLTDYRWLIYMLATVKHETADTFQPIREYGKGKGRKYGKTINGHVYYGRGYVQLTWDFNYKTMGKELGIDLYNNPDLALDLNIAAKIMFVGMEKGLFTGKKLSDYFSGNKEDIINARRIINGLDRANLIAGYYKNIGLGFKQL